MIILSQWLIILIWNVVTNINNFHSHSSFCKRSHFTNKSIKIQLHLSKLRRKPKTSHHCFLRAWATYSVPPLPPALLGFSDVIPGKAVLGVRDHRVFMWVGGWYRWATATVEGGKGAKKGRSPDNVEDTESPAEFPATQHSLIIQ